jgi:hypothetical protein
MIEEEQAVGPIPLWVRRATYIAMISLSTVGAMVTFALLWGSYFNAPPIRVENLNEKHLGTLCPGQVLMIENNVWIEDEIIVHYFISSMDPEGRFNYPGKQRAYTDYLHPRPSSFNQRLEWIVPDLPPGEYLRVFAVRKVSGNQDTVFVENLYRIGKDCKT